jgi:hypothetical protein
MNIVIVGGGFAGWICAFIMESLYNKTHKITLVESAKIGTIGVGEASTGFLRGIVNNEDYPYGCNEKDFMQQTNALPKLGVLFKDWQINKTFLEPIDSANQYNNISSFSLLLSHLITDNPIYTSSVNGAMVHSQISGFFKQNNQVFGANRHAYHFDATAAAKYFENKCKDNIKKIIGDIVDISLLENGEVEYLLLESQEKIYGDFFVDASGFSRIFNKKMGLKFIEKKEFLLNKAMPFTIDYENEEDIGFFTTAWAQKYGWMWMIPKQNNIGCGYIYDDNFIDLEMAKKEIEGVLKKEINVTREISFNAGNLENSWNKNVLSIGLSSLFLEPLEATSIHGTISQIYYFVFYCLKNTKLQTMNFENVKLYNENFKKMSHNFKTFVLCHYLNTRQDTDFWKQMNKNANNDESIKQILEILKTRLLDYYDLDSAYGASGYGLFNWVFCNLGIFTKENAMKEFYKLNREHYAQELLQDIKNYMYQHDWLSNKDFVKFIKGQSS